MHVVATHLEQALVQLHPRNRIPETVILPGPEVEVDYLIHVGPSRVIVDEPALWPEQICIWSKDALVPLDAPRRPRDARPTRDKNLLGLPGTVNIEIDEIALGRREFDQETGGRRPDAETFFDHCVEIGQLFGIAVFHYAVDGRGRARDERVDLGLEFDERRWVRNGVEEGGADDGRCGV